MKRCLILGCSETKIKTPAKLMALHRYDGPTFRVLRRFLADVWSTSARPDLEIFVLSAEFGLIKGEHLIPVYDRRMTPRRAEELRPAVLNTFKHQIASQNYTELFLSMGKTYLLALTGYEDLLLPTTRVIVSRSSSGQKLTELRAWLRGEEKTPAQLALPLNGPSTTRGVSFRVRGPVRIQGVELNFTPAEVYQLAREALAANKGTPDNYKQWYVLIDGHKVAPKWLVSQ
jgi:hypothetical protein